ncbi:hypothetical protein CBM2600_A140354 [Cupriavidus taiwanensis]|nr:hypothetical protein CBM2600_A140354 [Cupriavidus taiwanensis]
MKWRRMPIHFIRFGTFLAHEMVLYPMLYAPLAKNRGMDHDGGRREYPHRAEPAPSVLPDGELGDVDGYGNEHAHAECKVEGNRTGMEAVWGRGANMSHYGGDIGPDGERLQQLAKTEQRKRRGSGHQQPPQRCHSGCQPEHSHTAQGRDESANRCKEQNFREDSHGPQGANCHGGVALLTPQLP